MNIVYWIISIIFGLIGCTFIFVFIDDKIQSHKKPIKNGKVFPLKPWPDPKPGIHDCMKLLPTNTKEKHL